MSKLEDLFRRVEHLLVRHAEMRRTQDLLQQQVLDLRAERDALRGRLNQALARLDAVLERLPASTSGPDLARPSASNPPGSEEPPHDAPVDSTPRVSPNRPDKSEAEA